MATDAEGIKTIADFIRRPVPLNAGAHAIRAAELVAVADVAHANKIEGQDVDPIALYMAALVHSNVSQALAFITR